MNLNDEQFILLTTYRRDRSPVSTPVWWAPLEAGEYGFWTSSTSGKITRLRHTSRVTVQACNRRGTVKPGTIPIEATARIVTGAELVPLKAAVKAKYGYQTKIVPVIAKVLDILHRHKTPYADCGVIVTLNLSGA